MTLSAFQDRILPRVSRTFALTIPQLPGPLRQVVGNAYLLCRIADTIEDEPALDSGQKSRFSAAFIQVVAGQTSPQAFSESLAPLLSAASSPAEHELIRHTAEVVRLTQAFEAPQRQAMLRCIEIMSSGMADFQRQASRRGLRDLAELEAYCYCVAGVVGEMLTELFCAYSPAIAAQREPLYRLSRAFGQGLQMTNILKDVWEDWQRGACWLPREEFARHGFSLDELQPGCRDPEFLAGFEQLIGIAGECLRQALDYILLLPAKETGLRRFCLWAVGMAVLTLRRIARHPGFHSGQQVKISRRGVRGTILVTNLLTRHDRALRFLFDWYARDLQREKRPHE
jgi:farnesyl-diphosphate farnesyltransferase